MKTIGHLIGIFVIIFGIFGGWVYNIVKFVDCDFESPYKAEAIRGIGIPVFPVGVIVGWMEIEDVKKE